MKLYSTEISAIDPRDGILKLWAGPNVPGISFQTAQEYCDLNGLGYCKVRGILIAEVPLKPGTNEPDFDKMIDYEKPLLN